MRLANLHHTGTQVSVGPLSPPGALVNAGSKIASVMQPVSFPFFFSEKWTAKPMLIPLGEADVKVDGATRKQGIGLETPGAIKQIFYDARMIKPGVVWNREEGLRQLRSAPIAPATWQGRVLETIKRLDDSDVENETSTVVTISSQTNNE